MENVDLHQNNEMQDDPALPVKPANIPRPRLSTTVDDVNKSSSSEEIYPDSRFVKSFGSEGSDLEVWGEADTKRTASTTGAQTQKPPTNPPENNKEDEMSGGDEFVREDEYAGPPVSSLADVPPIPVRLATSAPPIPVQKPNPFRQGEESPEKPENLPELPESLYQPPNQQKMPPTIPKKSSTPPAIPNQSANAAPPVPLKRAPPAVPTKRATPPDIPPSLADVESDKLDSASPPPIPSKPVMGNNNVAIDVKLEDVDLDMTCRERVVGCFAAISLPFVICVPAFMFVFAGVVDFFGTVTFYDVVINLCLIFVGIMMFLVEFPRRKWNSFVQDPAFVWARFLTRAWGRAVFCGFFGLLALCDLESGAKIASGSIGLMTSLLMLILSWSARNKLWRLNEFLSAGQEGATRDGVLLEAFQALDTERASHIGMQHFFALAETADRVLLKSEAELIFRFFDERMQPTISREQWMQGFSCLQGGVPML